jgi:hypothetical protein
MKPRLSAAPLTPEDWEIWTGNWLGGRDVQRMYRYMSADRRDANMMYGAQFLRHYRSGHPLEDVLALQMELRYHDLLCGGALR